MLVIFVVLAAVGCSSNNESKDKSDTPASAEQKDTTAKESPLTYKDGTYEGISDSGMHPGLKVSVVVKSGKIAEVNVVENGETEGVGSQAVEKLPAEIVKAQSTDVEPVSGASKSSAAIKEAVDSALSQAK